MKKRKSTIVSRMFEEAGEVELVEVKVLKRVESRHSQPSTDDTAQYAANDDDAGADTKGDD
ncbi:MULTISPECIES: hypothetical protein [Hyphomonas]|uniref:hypothetical protein n=1 Tax=Hyphomonas TaxID=85 RepID=UPI003512576E